MNTRVADDPFDLGTRAPEERHAKEDLAGRLAEQIAIARRASEEKSRFFASASHDLRQPLHAIALFGAVLDRDLKGTPHQTNAADARSKVKAALGAWSAAWRGGARTIADDNCYKKRSMHHELDTLCCPHPGTGA